MPLLLCVVGNTIFLFRSVCLRNKKTRGDFTDEMSLFHFKELRRRADVVKWFLDNQWQAPVATLYADIIPPRLTNLTWYLPAYLAGQGLTRDQILLRVGQENYESILANLIDRLENFPASPEAEVILAFALGTADPALVSRVELIPLIKNRLATHQGVRDVGRLAGWKYEWYDSRIETRAAYLAGLDLVPETRKQWLHSLPAIAYSDEIIAEFSLTPQFQGDDAASVLFAQFMSGVAASSVLLREADDPALFAHCAQYNDSDDPDDCDSDEVCLWTHRPEGRALSCLPIRRSGPF